jgi:WD40 repeat protein
MHKVCKTNYCCRVRPDDPIQHKFTLSDRDNNVLNAVFSPDSTRVVTTYETGCSPQLWNVQTGQLIHTLEGHVDIVEHVAFSPCGSMFVTGSWDSTAIVWDTESGRIIATLPHDVPHHVTSVAFSNDGDMILTGSSDGVATLWNIDYFGIIRTFEGHEEGNIVAAFSHDDMRVSTASEDSTVCIWGADTWACSSGLIHVFVDHEAMVNSAIFSPDGDMILTKSEDNTSNLYDTESGELLYSFDGYEGSCMVCPSQFSPDGSLLISADDCDVCVWSTTSFHCLHVLEGHDSEVHSLAFSPDGEHIAGASCDQDVIIWDTSTGEIEHTLIGHDDMVLNVSYSPDGSTMATASCDGTVKLWTIQ